MQFKQFILAIMLIATLSTTACAPAASQNTAADDSPTAADGGEAALLSHQNVQAVEVERSAEVPALPFEDNPDPALCGIPQQWSSDEPAYLSGIYQGELIQPEVFLYDSHLRREVVGRAPHGAEIQILLSQSNPTLDYFMVKVLETDPSVEGWVPAPFVSFEQPPNDLAYLSADN